MKNKDAIPALPVTDQHHLSAAEGWLELGSHLESNAELDEIHPLLRTHPDVLAVRWHIYTRAGKWADALEIGTTLVRLVPDRTEGWIHRSYCLHELKRTPDAFDLLLPAADKFSDCWTIPYNLACYAAQLGRIESAELWFKRALALNEMEVRLLAIDDPDLNPIWESRQDRESEQMS